MVNLGSKDQGLNSNIFLFILKQTEPNVETYYGYKGTFMKISLWPTEISKFYS